MEWSIIILIKHFSMRQFTLSIIYYLSLSLLCLPAVAQSGISTTFSSSIPDSKRILPETQYTLGAGDLIQVYLFQEPDFSGEYLILVDGTIDLPLLGSISVEGLTISQARALLSQSYAFYLKNPAITVRLITPRPLKIAIAGEIPKPGSYTLNLINGQTFPSVTDLISQAGGLTTAADISQVQIRRFIQGQEQVVRLDLLPLIEQGDLSQDITLRDGDSIFIPTKEEINPKEIRQLADANFGIQVSEVDVAIVGEVFRPGSHTIRAQGVTTRGDINLRLPRLTLAIQQAGGVKPLADIRRIEIRRLTRTGSEKTLEVDLWQLLETGDLDEDIILQQGDMIIIPTAKEIDPEESEALASASFAPNFIRVNVVGEVRQPGVVEVPPNTPLNQAILAAGSFDKRRADFGVVELIRLNFNGTVSKTNIPVDFAAGIEAENNPTLRNNDVIIVNRNTITAVTDSISTVVSPIGSLLGLANFVNIFDRR